MRPTPWPFLLTALLWTHLALAAEPPQGTWSLQLQGDTVILGLREPEHTLTLTVPRAHFQGLAPTEGTDTRFQLVREAGTVSFEGRFLQDQGAGHYRFTPSAAWDREMEALGYTDFSDRERFTAAIFDLGPTHLKALASLGYTRIPRKKLLEVALFQVTPEHVLALRAAGFGSLTLEELLQARIHQVTPAFIREIREAGYSSVTFAQLVRLRIHAINADSIRSFAAVRKSGGRE